MLKEGTFDWANSLMMQGIHMKRKGWAGGWTMHRAQGINTVISTRFYKDGTVASAPDSFDTKDMHANDWIPYYTFNLGEL